MSARDRYVILDDGDSALRYSSGWTTVSGSDWDSRGNFGRTYGGTLHSANTGASFTTTFRGSAGRVTGTINTRTTNGVVDPTWECRVDDRVYRSTSYSTQLNNYDLCKWFSNEVADGEHTLTVTVRSNGRAFLFDRFQYVPSPSTTISDGEISVSYLDPAVQYGSGWQQLGDIGYMATNGGAVVNIPFYGTGITWIGVTPSELPRSESRAQWQIDGGPPTSFTVPGTSSLTNHFVQVFRTSSVTRGHHILTVTHLGTTSLTPLVVSRIQIHNGMLPEPARPASPVPIVIGGGGSAGDSNGGDGDGNGNGGGNSGGDGNSGDGHIGGGDGGTDIGFPGDDPDDGEGGGGGIGSIGGSNGSASISRSAGRTASPTSTRTLSTAYVTTTVTAADGSVRITAIPDPLAVVPSNPGSTDRGLNAQESTRPNVGAIVGGALGGLILIGMIGFVLFWVRRMKARARKSSGDSEHREHIMPFIDNDGYPSNTSRENISNGSVTPFPNASHATTISGIRIDEPSSKGSVINRNPAAVAVLTNEKSVTPIATRMPPSLARSSSMTSHGHSQPASPENLTNTHTTQTWSSEAHTTHTIHTSTRKHEEASANSTLSGTISDIQHEDSGIRLITDDFALAGRRVVIEHPPVYSAS